MCKIAEDIQGGLGDGVSDSSVDPVQLAKGIKVELEHTSDFLEAKEIAKDHLMEDPEYYDRLAEMEEEAAEEQAEKEEERRDAMSFLQAIDNIS